MYLAENDDVPNIGLALSFDKVPQELVILGYLLIILVVITIVFLILHIWNFTARKQNDNYSRIPE